MEVLPGAIKLPAPVAQKLHQGYAGAVYFGFVRLEKVWSRRGHHSSSWTLGALAGALAGAVDPRAGAAAVALGVVAWVVCRVRTRAYGRKASAA